MKALVTGANGFVGRHVVERLVAGGAAVRALVRQAPSAAVVEAIRQRHAGADIEVATGNLLSADAARAAVKGADVVYHLAASMKGSPADMFLNTVVASKNVLEAVKRRKRIRLVLVSSMGVYGVSGLKDGSSVDENAPLEPHPERRDVYSHAKWRQEMLFREYAERYALPLTVVRPGVVYGPGGAALSARVGLNLFGLFLHLGGKSPIPLSYVSNCADAIVLAGGHGDAAGQAYNVHDDDLPTSAEYLRRYRREVEGIRFVKVPYPVMAALSRGVEWYNGFSRGQLPAVFTPYKAAAIWRGMRFDNTKIKRLGWRQRVSTAEGLAAAFAWLRESRADAGA